MLSHPVKKSTFLVQGVWFFAFFRPIIVAQNFFVLTILKIFTKKDKKVLSYDNQPLIVDRVSHNRVSHNRGSEIICVRFS